MSVSCRFPLQGTQEVLVEFGRLNQLCQVIAELCEGHDKVAFDATIDRPGVVLLGVERCEDVAGLLLQLREQLLQLVDKFGLLPVQFEEVDDVALFEDLSMSLGFNEHGVRSFLTSLPFRRYSLEIVHEKFDAFHEYSQVIQQLETLFKVAFSLSYLLLQLYLVAGNG